MVWNQQLPESSTSIMKLVFHESLPSDNTDMTWSDRHNTRLYHEPVGLIWMCLIVTQSFSFWCFKVKSRGDPEQQLQTQNSFLNCDPTMEWAAQECGSIPLETTITRVTGVLIKTSRGILRELTGLEWISIFKGSNKDVDSDNSPTKMRFSKFLRFRSHFSLFHVFSKLVWSTIDCSLDFLQPRAPFGWCKSEFYDEALLMYVIANSFLAGRGRLWEQILTLLQCNWNIHGHITS